jgi:hypothetical protein
MLSARAFSHSVSSTVLGLGVSGASAPQAAVAARARERRVRVLVLMVRIVGWVGVVSVDLCKSESFEPILCEY